MIENLSYTVTGEEKMYCGGCETRVKNALQRLEGVYEATANHREQDPREH